MDRDEILYHNREVLRGFEPADVFRHFLEICARPHCTYHEKALCDYIEAFAVAHGLPCMRDDLGNLILRRDASPGLEGRPGLILQSHLDMVGETDRKDFDFVADPIALRLEGGSLYAEHTTLGADDGIGAAMILALLEDDTLPHPPLEAVFTVQEEVGQQGIRQLDMSSLRGRLLINLDHETAGEYLVSCAGGIRVFPQMSAPRPLDSGEGLCNYRLSVGGLQGGHSGTDIHKDRGNAIKILGRLLSALFGRIPFRLASVRGGMKNNAIARNCEAVIALEESDVPTLRELFVQLSGQIAGEYRSREPGIRFSCETADAAARCFRWEDTENIIRAMWLMPSGLVAKSAVFEGVTESSLNLGVIEGGNGRVRMEYLIRSSLNSAKYDMRDQVAALAERFGFDDVQYGSDYPAWEYTIDPAVETCVRDVYRTCFGKEMKRTAIHGGVECCYARQKLPWVDAISIGPDIFAPHGPAEHVDLASVRETYRFLRALLTEIQKLPPGGSR